MKIVIDIPKKLIDEIQKSNFITVGQGYAKKLIDYIKKGTPLEQEPKTGRWIKTIGENGITSAVRCSECGFEDNRYMLFRYCPYCGAKMVEPQESEVKE